LVIDYITKVLTHIHECQAVYVKRLLSGTFDDLRDYKCIYGKLSGLKEAEEIVKNVYKILFENGRSQARRDENDEVDQE
jgi:hypothetical protein